MGPALTIYDETDESAANAERLRQMLAERSPIVLAPDLSHHIICALGDVVGHSPLVTRQAA